MTLQVDEELDELISRIKLQEGNTEFWKSRFLGDGLQENYGKQIEVEDSEIVDVSNDADAVDDVAKEVEEDEAEDEEEEVDLNDSQVVDRIKAKEVETAKPLPMIGVQLFKDSDETTSSSRKSRRKISRMPVEV